MPGNDAQTPLTTIFVDLNAYFASVEQQERPELRGRPVAVVPLMTDSTCCIAASYEARPFGVRTGTRVGDAKKLCPQIVLVEARTEAYVRCHHRILEAVETVIPIEKVWSIDEFTCRLLGAERRRDRAVTLGLAIKRAIRERVGEHLRCSVGIAPNRLLAKMASDIQKPDGMVAIESADLPHRLHALELRDIPGVGAKMEERLHSAGVRTMAALCALDEKAMAAAWGSVVGAHYWRWLRGEETHEAASVKRSIGHQHVLAPELREASRARGVMIRLLTKAASRLRKERHWARRLTLDVRYEGEGSWRASARFPESRDTMSLLGHATGLWKQMPAGRLLRVGVVLEELVEDRFATPPLFGGAEKGERLSQVIDLVNAAHGRDAIYPASMHEAKGSAPARIAFGSIPEGE